MMRSRFLALCFILPLFLSCGLKSAGTLMREDLFSLSIGRMEDQIDLFQIDSFPVVQKTRITLDDGIFTVGNGNSSKVMQFNSYGDLISLYYDAELNPKPVILRSTDDTGTVTTRRSFVYPFRQVGEIAVNSQKMLYAEERLPDSRRIVDDALGAVLDRVVLVFSRTGEMTGYIGQEGMGGSPFPYVDRLTVTDNDEIVVVARTMKAWLIFWYTPGGKLLSRADIPLDSLPVPDGEEIIPFLETIYPSPEGETAYLKFNYYREAIDPATKKKFRVENLPSRIYTLDMRTGTYRGWVDVPRNIVKPEDLDLFEKEGREYGSQFMGATRGGYLYFISPKEPNFYELFVLNKSGRVTARRNIVLEDNELVFKTFYLSPEGILTALLGKAYGADIVWWRSDRLIRRD